MEINLRAVYGRRRIGIGHSLLSKLCGMLNMPTPMSNKGYNHTAIRMKQAAKTIVCMEKHKTPTNRSMVQYGIGYPNQTMLVFMMLSNTLMLQW